MKKSLSLFLAFIMVLLLCVTGFAAGTGWVEPTAKDPVVYISGDSGWLEYNYGNNQFNIGHVGNLFDSNEDSNVKEAVINVLQPFLLEGLLFNRWDNYYAALEKEIGELFEPIAMDKNGDPKEGTGIISSSRKDLEYSRKNNIVERNGGYKETSYRFYYDWRMDPLEVAEQLNDYIEDVKKATGHDKVNLSVRCLGCNVALAYVDRYGTDSLHGLAIDVATSLGSDFLGGMLSGDFGIDGFALSRFLYDLNLYSKAGIDEFVMESIELLASSGLTNLSLEMLRKTLYSRIESGVISALATGTLMTMPCYWGMVPVEQFDKAVNNVFGPEGSEKREEYAGLIEKITAYNEEIKKNVYPILRSIEDAGVNIAVISKYGTQLVPVLKDGSMVADFYVSAERSSFGATTSTVYGQLSDEYIAERTELGFGKYISPDKQIDASTCLFRDYTWFFKGVEHGYYTKAECEIMMAMLNADEQLDISDIEELLGWTQYTVYDYLTDTAEPMTEENCRNTTWTADETIDRPQNMIQKIRAYFIKLTDWYKSLFRLLKNLIDSKKQTE
ncbi:MAG: hypothetical protein J1E34_05300 [Oscillospiraceae bacterium]|nr:hypothetical protein [Oscillospiraceae bacterium]